MTIKEWLAAASAELKQTDIQSTRLDAEIILAHTLRKPRTYLHAHDDEVLDMRTREIADARLRLRIDRVPIAYIIGHKEFYGRNFLVNSATLVPRPESEEMIAMLLALELDEPRIVDVGTGSGALGITAALECMHAQVACIDIDNRALEVARKNAARLQADVDIVKSDLLDDYVLQPDVVLANLPYIDREWDVSPETQHEPDLALYAIDNGTALIKKLFDQLHARWDTARMHVFIEADPRQHRILMVHAEKRGFTLVQTRGFIAHYGSGL